MSRQKKKATREPNGAAPLRYALRESERLVVNPDGSSPVIGKVSKLLALAIFTARPSLEPRVSSSERNYVEA